jgi:hypothetical protein
MLRVAAAMALALTWTTASWAADFEASVIASDLNNPRGLSFGPDGALYIAEAGIAAGTGPSTVSRGELFTYTLTGSVTRYLLGTQSRIFTGLPSIYGSVNAHVNGPNDIVFNAAGMPVLAIGLGQNPLLRSTDLAPGGTNLAQVMTLGGNSVDVGQYEAINNPAGGPIDSNPWRLDTVPGGMLMTDAGGNSLLRIGDDGGITTLATFPSRTLGPVTFESVTTGVAVGMDGSYYVGELTGFPFPPGGAQVYRVPSGGGTPTVFATGFTMISDLAFGPDGSLYALEYDSNGLLNPGLTGALWKVAPDGSRSLIYGDLTLPTGLAIGSDGAFYVSNFGASTGRGEIVRIAAAIPEPETYALILAGLGMLGAVTRKRRRAGRTAVVQPQSA